MDEVQFAAEAFDHGSRQLENVAVQFGFVGVEVHSCEDSLNAGSTRTDDPDGAGAFSE